MPARFGLTLATVTWVSGLVPLSGTAWSPSVRPPGPRCWPAVRSLLRTADVSAAFAFSGGLKPGHAATTHGIPVLPVHATVLARGGRDERHRTAVVRVACAGCLLFAGVVVVACLAGIDPGLVAVPVLTTCLAVAGVVVLGVAGLTALLGLRRRAFGQ